MPRAQRALRRIFVRFLRQLVDRCGSSLRRLRWRVEERSCSDESAALPVRMRQLTVDRCGSVQKAWQVCNALHAPNTLSRSQRIKQSWRHMNDQLIRQLIRIATESRLYVLNIASNLAINSSRTGDIVALQRQRSDHQEGRANGRSAHEARKGGG